MPLRLILRICECGPCIEKDLSLAELQLLAQQQELHERRHRSRQHDRMPLVQSTTQERPNFHIIFLGLIGTLFLFNTLPPPIFYHGNFWYGYRCPYSLMDKTRGFYPFDPGSIPGGGTSLRKESEFISGFFLRLLCACLGQNRKTDQRESGS